MRRLLVSLILLLVSLTGACAPAIVTPDVDAIYTAAIQTISVQLTEMARPTATDTVTPTLTPSPTLTATATSTPGSNFAQIRLAGIGPGAGNLSMLIFDLPGLSADPGKYRILANGVPGSCNSDARTPDKLYCSVDFPNEALVYRIKILPVDSELVLYEFILEATATPNYPTPAPLSHYLSEPACVVEPLYQPGSSNPFFLDPANAGCYAISCQASAGGSCGTQNSCVYMPPSGCP